MVLPWNLHNFSAERIQTMSEFFYPLKEVFLVKFSVNSDMIDQAYVIVK